VNGADLAMERGEALERSETASAQRGRLSAVRRPPAIWRGRPTADFAQRVADLRLKLREFDNRALDAFAKHSL
jgi:hypothetical protein